MVWRFLYLLWYDFHPYNLSTAACVTMGLMNLKIWIWFFDEIYFLGIFTQILTKQNADINHYCRFSLGGSCNHICQWLSCDNYKRCLPFFDKRVKWFLSPCVGLLTDTYEVSDLQTMSTYFPKLDFAIKTYMSHRLQTKL